MLFRLALRNLRRNLRRSIITVLAISVGLMVLILSLTLRTGQYDQMINSGVSQLAGHVVVQKAGYQEDREVEDYLTGRAEIADKLRAIDPKGTVTTRMFLTGILQSTSGSTFASVNGIDPLPEKGISEFTEKVVVGEWLDEKENGILIGQNMADSLGIDLTAEKPRNKLTFRGKFGKEPVGKVFRVKGIFRTGNDQVDSFVSYIHYEAAEELLGEKDVAHQVALHLDNAKNTDSATADAREQLSGSDLDIMTWSEALPEIVTMIQMDSVSNESIGMVIMLIVTMGILNTMLMSVLERTRELGVVLALGMRPRRLAWMVICEGFLLGVFGAILGLCLGLAVCYPLVTSGLDFSAQMGENMDVAGAVTSTIIYGKFDWQFMSIYLVGAVLLSMASALYPAWRITRMNPVEAMRHH
jgi:ABC-type lipoprotein release transport system permease subunit